MLTNKHVLLGVTGGIAAYKACQLASSLVKQHAAVNVIMTRNATEFVTPLTFDALTHTRTVTDTFDRQHSYEVEHISLAQKADLLIIAPATANMIAKLANGIADDMLSTTAMACTCPKLITPAMNTNMYENPAVQRNIRRLKEDGWEVIEPDSGHLACGTSGKGRLPDPEVLLEAVDHAIAQPKDMKGLKVLVTAGPTQEALDPVRYLTNHSSGKMGYAIAVAASQRGADVTLVTGPTALEKPGYMILVPVISAEDMYQAVVSRAADQDIIIKAAAVADFRPSHVAEDKIKKFDVDGKTELPLEKTRDILGYLGSHKRPADQTHKAQILCGFSMETKDMIENSRKKLENKHLDLIAANNVKESGAGFAVDTNRLTLITPDEQITLPLMTKYEAANQLLSQIMKMRG